MGLSVVCSCACQFSVDLLANLLMGEVLIPVTFSNCGLVIVSPANTQCTVSL